MPAAHLPPASADHSRPRGEIREGIRASFAAGLGMVPIGVAFGILVVQAGLPWWLAPGLSLAAFAGSLELIVVGLLAAAAPLATIAVTAVLVNFRHVFYAFTFPLYVVRSRVGRLYSVYALIDEAYAVTATRQADWTGRRLLAMQVAFHTYWVGGGLLGVFLAHFIPGTIRGLGFALCALFITLTLDACRSARHGVTLVLAAASFAIAVLLTPDSALVVALLLFTGSLVFRFALVRWFRG
nr:AzlC family ABC transporter permease [Zhihengliuella flava]